MTSGSLLSFATPLMEKATPLMEKIAFGAPASWAAFIGGAAIARS